MVLERRFIDEQGLADGIARAFGTVGIISSLSIHDHESRSL